MVFEIFFLIICNAYIDFQAQNLQWRSYTTGDIFLTIRQVELIRQKKFTIVVLDPKHEVLVVHVATLYIDPDDEVYPSQKVQIVHLKADKALIKVPSKYVDFIYVFSQKFTIKLPKYIEINNHTIELGNDW